MEHSRVARPAASSPGIFTGSREGGLRLSRITCRRAVGRRPVSADQLRPPLTGLRLQLEASLDDPNAGHRETIKRALIITDRLDKTITDPVTLAWDAPRNGDVLDIDAALFSRPPGAVARNARRGRTAAADQQGRRRPSHRGVGVAATQILDALLDNAARHGRGDVDVRAAADAVAIDVTNEGPPVAVSSPEPFRVRMGLSLAHRLAEVEGGRLTRTAKTPTFTLLLPVHEEAHDPASGARSPNEAAP